MRVGILTFHSVPNYGAALQAYALYTAVRSLCDEVEIIDYTSAGIERYYRLGLPCSPRGAMSYLRKVKKYHRVDRFIRSHVKVGAEGIRGDGYDAIVCGSDQIWSVESAQGCDLAYFLDFAGDRVRKISYAPSANETDSFGNNREELARLLKRFHAVSVRDSHTLDLLRKECGVDACKVVDPTFLVDFDELIDVPGPGHPYLLVYLNGRVHEEVVHLICDISRARRLDIVAIDGFPGGRVQKRYALGLGEWLGLFRDADYVVTNTFHGTVFSIKYQKPFTVPLSSHKRAKVYDLLQDLELVHAAGKAGALDREIDYARVNAILNGRATASWQYLENALTGGVRSATGPAAVQKKPDG